MSPHQYMYPKVTPVAQAPSPTPPAPLQPAAKTR